MASQTLSKAPNSFRIFQRPLSSPSPHPPWWYALRESHITNCTMYTEHRSWTVGKSLPHPPWLLYNLKKGGALGISGTSWDLWVVYLLRLKSSSEMWFFFFFKSEKTTTNRHLKCAFNGFQFLEFTNVQVLTEKSGDEKPHYQSPFPFILFK